MNRRIQPLVLLLIVGAIVAVTLILRGTGSKPATPNKADALVFQAPSSDDGLTYPPGNLKIPTGIKPIAFDFPPPPIPKSATQADSANVRPDDTVEESIRAPMFIPDVEPGEDKLGSMNRMPPDTLDLDEQIELPPIASPDRQLEWAPETTEPPISKPNSTFNLPREVSEDFNSSFENQPTVETKSGGNFQFEAAAEEDFQPWRENPEAFDAPSFSPADPIAAKADSQVERLPPVSDVDNLDLSDNPFEIPPLNLNDLQNNESPVSQPSIDEAPRPVAEPEPIDVSLPQPAKNADLTVAEQMAEEHIRRGTSLATRNAYFSARKEFEVALKLICRALDAQAGTPGHSRKLADGLTALHEADDFAISDQNDWQNEADLASVVVGHRTGVLKDLGDQRISPWVARQRYYSFAQQQLAEACGGLPVASRALYGLGKWYSLVAVQSDGMLVAGPKAVVFHQAALSVDPRNYLAANELGVLLARFGKLDDARRILQHAVALAGQPEAWHNLAVVHTRLGEIDLAKRARYEHQVSIDRDHRAPTTRADGPVRWVDPQDFIRMSPRSDAPRAQTQPQPIGPASNSAAVPSWMN